MRSTRPTTFPYLAVPTVLACGPSPFVPDFEDWLASEAADDYNDDGEIDEEDFKLFVDRLFEGRPDGPFVPDFEDWLASDEAEDLNEDGEIDEADYVVSWSLCLVVPVVLSFLPILRIGWPATKPRI